MDKRLKNMLLSVLALIVIAIITLVVPASQLVYLKYLLLIADIITSVVCFLNAVLYVIDSIKLVHD